METFIIIYTAFAVIAGILISMQTDMLNELHKGLSKRHPDWSENALMTVHFFAIIFTSIIWPVALFLVLRDTFNAWNLRR